MGTTYAEVTIRSTSNGRESFTGKFLVDTGAFDCVVSSDVLERIGVLRVGRRDYELADGRRVLFDYGIIQIELMGEITAGRVVFGPEGVEPLIGVVALESAALKVNPITQELEKMEVSLLK
jgi:clan AA aspartic protease